MKQLSLFDEFYDIGRLNYRTIEINRHFRIKISGTNLDGTKVHIAVGVSGLVKLVGTEIANHLLDRAFSSKDDKCICKLRRGLKITFYNK